MFLEKTSQYGEHGRTFQETLQCNEIQKIKLTASTVVEVLGCVERTPPS